ncbi:MAG: methyltransferase domain-containing protein [Intestinibacter sp.]|uniref:class I SAM-dependent methyltransferase n=1 Tax=Intestinibacter sp. TaxID=1965304 RepID=UPI002A83C275|nr:methyltransferase domain-containing protein [Intestinibacter sp.]MDY4575229.1 methyltransferase domain-containing protein [Intestinibacter sp.]
MRMNWNDCTIKAFNKASEYTRFHEIVAEKIKSYTEDTNTLCDMGCGLALVDIYLSKYIKDITCVDVNETVIEYAKKNAEKKNVDNIKFLVSDFKDVEGFFDTILISFFSYEDVAYFSKHCNKLIVIVNNSDKTHIPVSEKRHEAINLHTAENLKNLLDQKNLKYSVETMNLQFGQPFENEDEIRDYADGYNESGENDKIFEHVMQNIQKGDGVAYYLPHDKRISIFAVEFDK